MSLTSVMFLNNYKKPLCSKCNGSTYPSWESSNSGTKILGFQLCRDPKCGHKEYFPGEEPDLMEIAFDQFKSKKK